MTRHTGKVTWFDEKNGFGFLACRHAADVFIDLDAMVGESRLPLRRGDRVLFDIVDSDVGPKAGSIIRCKEDDPASRLAGAQAEQQEAREFERWAAPVHSGLQTILLIEQEDTLRARRTEHLWAAGYLVAACRDACSAADVYQSNLSIDLVISSLLPPRSLQGWVDDLSFLSPTTPVLLSAPLFPLDLWRAMRTRHIRFVPRACSVRLLLGAVRLMLRPARREAA